MSCVKVLLIYLLTTHIIKSICWMLDPTVSRNVSRGMHTAIQGVPRGTGSYVDDSDGCEKLLLMSLSVRLRTWDLHIQYEQGRPSGRHAQWRPQHI